MRIYPEKQKAKLIEQMLPPHNVSVPQIHQESGIPKDTLYGWRRQAQRARGLPLAPALNGNRRWSAAERFAMVVETAAMNEAQVGEYCRKYGLYPEQLQSWRQACEQATAAPTAGLSESTRDIQADKRRIRELERELKRKEKALAEAAAVLVLQKKAQAIWGDSEAD